MEFKRLSPVLQRFVITCSILGTLCLCTLLLWRGPGSFPPLTPPVFAAAAFLGLLFTLAKRFQVHLEPHINLNGATVVVASAFYMWGPWILLPLMISGLVSDLVKKERKWVMALNLSSDAIRFIPASHLFIFAGGELAFTRLELPVLLSTSLFYLWFTMSDFVLIRLFTAACTTDSPGEGKSDHAPLITDLFFYPLALLVVLTLTILGPCYLILIAVPLAGLFYLYRYSLGKKEELQGLARLNRELATLSTERAGLLIESEKRAEEMERVHSRLLQAEKLASMGKLAAGLAHELNTPLGTILTNAEFALSFTDDADMETSLGMIKKAALRCRTITENLLAYSRKEELRATVFLLSRAVEETLAALDPLVRNAGITVEQQGDPSTELQGVYESFIQILHNILKNSIDAIEMKGEREGKIILHWLEKNGTLLLSIKDNGAGMTEEIMEKIFDPFFTTKEVGKGTGLGLWLTRHLVEMYRGKISLRTGEGEGSEFILEIPREKLTERRP